MRQVVTGRRLILLILELPLIVFLVACGEGSSPYSTRPTVTPSTKPKQVGTKLFVYTDPVQVNAIAWSPNGKYIAVGDENGNVRVLDGKTGSIVQTYGQETSIRAIAWSPDSKYIASGNFNIGEVLVWDIMANRKVLTYTGPTFAVTAVSWSPNGKYIASGGFDSNIQGEPPFTDHFWIWDARTGNVQLSIRTKSVITSLAWSPDGKYIASGSDDSTVQIWDTHSGKMNVSCGNSVPGLFADSIAWSPDGAYIVSNKGAMVQIYDTKTGDTRLNFVGHTGIVHSLAWSPDGKYIVSGSEDKTVQVWDVSTGRSLFIYHGHARDVYAVAWSPNNQFIASGGADYTLQVWQAPQ